MPKSKLFDLQGLNLWLLAGALGLNFIWAALVCGAASLYLLSTEQASGALAQVGVMAGLFGLPFLTGWVAGRLSHSDRGPTYGLLGSLSAATVALIVFFPGGVFGLLAAVAALSGGFNGGQASLRRDSRG